jgi:hypothetical protein
MATDVTARGIVSKSMSDFLKVDRSQLVRERCDMKLNYGGLFLAHELTAAGAKMEDIAAQLKAGKKILQIASDQTANWREIEAHAKKLNNKIADNIFNHFLHNTVDRDRDLADHYDSTKDWVKADADVTLREIFAAQDTYVLWRDRAAPSQGQTMDFAHAQMARDTFGDPAHDLAPKTPGASPK